MTRENQTALRTRPHRAVVDRIIEERGRGKGPSRIAKELNADEVESPSGGEWSRSAVETVFKNATGSRRWRQTPDHRDAVAKRRTVKLPDWLDARLQFEANRRRMTVSELTREAIEAHVGDDQRRFLAAGSGRSGQTDIARRIEELLEEEWHP
jgi:predicted DNA-binding protein